MKKFEVGIENEMGQTLASTTINAASEATAWNRIGELFTLGYNEYAVIRHPHTHEKLYCGIGREYRKIKPDEDDYYLSQRAAKK